MDYSTPLIRHVVGAAEHRQAAIAVDFTEVAVDTSPAPTRRRRDS